MKSGSVVMIPVRHFVGGKPGAGVFTRQYKNSPNLKEGEHDQR